jgi:2-polyprenyl-3-methyl-5-hydroxy-6-metoxy-1,4-benzoquinol methylase
MDKSNGYQAIASSFLSVRERSKIGVSVVDEWSRLLSPGAAVLDIGCGGGVPISELLIERGYKVYGVDASRAMVTAFRHRFPAVSVECCAVEESAFFNRSFDAVVAWGLFFLLGAEAQRGLIAKIAGVLPRGGKLLFTAPREAVCWPDSMTGQMSISLGREGYRQALETEDLLLVGERVDEGENHYYLAAKAIAVTAPG